MHNAMLAIQWWKPPMANEIHENATIGLAPQWPTEGGIGSATEPLLGSYSVSLGPRLLARPLLLGPLLLLPAAGWWSSCGPAAAICLSMALATGPVSSTSLLNML